MGAGRWQSTESETKNFISQGAASRVHSGTQASVPLAPEVPYDARGPSDCLHKQRVVSELRDTELGESTVL